ncbi:hypothetical protein SteCoe_34424 [Stentor coeruleus]|uniref:Uncharacterized protein n=1 Tax=Stentor coeruleus TaxID=5963 RepID=A0A1R2AUK5_9CILI|nr:hypothetical protein SteCoe_34424 [Stentor coeruleus]
MADQTEAIKRLEDSKRSKFIKVTSFYLGNCGVAIIIILLVSKYFKIHIIIPSAFMIISTLLSLKASYKVVCIALMILDGLITLNWVANFFICIYEFIIAYISFMSICTGDQCALITRTSVESAIISMITMPVCLVIIYYLLNTIKAAYKYLKDIKEIESTKSN